VHAAHAARGALARALTPPSPPARAQLEPQASSAFERSRAALQMFRPDAALLSTLSLDLHASVCDALRVPFAVAHRAPLLPTGSGTPPLGGLSPSRLLPSYNRAVWRLLNRLRWAVVYRSIVNAQRAQLGLAPIVRASGAVGTYVTHARPPRRTLLLYSPALGGAPPADWPAGCRPTGLPQLGPAQRPLPEAVQQFLSAAAAAGDRVVAVSLGADSARAGEAAAAAALAAGCVVALLLSRQPAPPAAAADALGAPVTLLRLPPPHPPLAALLPHLAALVTDGSAAAAHAAARAGLPCCVLWPATGGEGEFWGGRLVAAGACAIAAPAGPRLDASALEGAIRRCVRDEKLRARCARLAAAMAEEAPAEEAAVTALLEMAGKRAEGIEEPPAAASATP